MVPLRRLNRHRSAIATAVAVAAVVAVVGGIAVTSGGYTAQRIDLGDAAVWVPNDGMQSIGRASTAALELNSLVETGGGRVEVAQSGSTVLVLDPDRASVGIIDVTTSSAVEQPVAVPPDQPDGDARRVEGRGRLAGRRVDVAGRRVRRLRRRRRAQNSHSGPKP